MLALLPTFLRECFGNRTFAREPEPALVMEDAEQVTAYAEAGRIDGVMAAAYLFHTARISQVIQGCQRVIDFGCGPATQLAQVAQFNPRVSFLGIDLSERMLASAEAYVRALGLRNVSFAQTDITRPEIIGDHAGDAVISTMTLHHLPTLSQLRACFQHINRVLRPGGAVYVADFGRLKSLKSVLFFAYRNRARQPAIFSLDYERSLRAAFLPNDLESAAAETLSRGVKVYTTFRVPLLTILKSEDRPLPDEARRRLKGMREALHRRYRRDLDDLRLFFRLGGLGNDPFR